MNNSNDIGALRAALFETLNGLKDGTINVEKARAINETCQTIINSAKVEVDYARATGRATGTGFVPVLEAPAPAPVPEPGSNGSTLTPTGTKTISGNTITHRMH